MSSEIEMKFGLVPGVLPRFHAFLSELGAVDLGRRRLVSVYYDTTGRELKAMRIGFRIRHDGTRLIQTIKGDGRQLGGLSRRREHEAVVAEDRPDAGELGPFTDRVEPYLDYLKPIFTTDFLRKTWLLRSPSAEALELVLDEGVIHGDTQVSPLFEIEVELKQGDPRFLLETGEALARAVPLFPETLSKAARGHGLSRVAPCSPTPLPHPAENVSAASGRGDWTPWGDLQHGWKLARYGSLEEGLAVMRLASARLRMEMKDRGEAWTRVTTELDGLAEELAVGDLDRLLRSGTLGRLWTCVWLLRFLESPDLGKLFPK